MRVFILIATLLLSSCSSTNTEKVIQDDLVGTWELLYNDQGSYWFSHIGFTKEGQKCSISYQFNNNKDIEVDYFLSDFSLVRGDIILTVQESTSAFVERNQVIKDHLITHSSVSFTQQMFYPIAGDSVDTFVKLNTVKPESICKVVKNQFNTPMESSLTSPQAINKKYVK